MTDLRQGVTPTQHEVLDLIETSAPAWADELDFEEQLKLAANLADVACKMTLLSRKRRFAIEAAARLIDAADEIGRLITLDGDGD
jgi:hypothetical protein